MAVQVSRNPRFHAKSGDTNRIIPGNNWNGLAGSGGAAPSESNIARGTGFWWRPIAQWDQPPHVIVGESPSEITIAIDHADTGWIDHIEVWCEGRSRFLRPTDLQLASSGAIGLMLYIDGAAFPRDGTAQLYAYVRPVNGRERKIGPINIHRIPDSRRPRRYLSTSGSDTADGLTPDTAWQTFNYASRLAPDLAIIECAAGDYRGPDSVVTQVVRTKPVEFRPANGLTKDQVVMGRENGAIRAAWRPATSHIIWRGMTIDASAVTQLWMGAFAAIIDCDTVTYPSAVNGTDTWPGIPEPVQIGYRGAEVLQVGFRDSEGQHISVIGGKLELPCTAGARLMRNLTMKTGWDVTFIGRDIAMFNCVATQESSGSMWGRMHALTTLTPSAAPIYTAGTVTHTTKGWQFPGTSVIQWPAGTDLDGLLHSDGLLHDRMMTVLTGALAGQVFYLYSQDATTKQTVVYGDISELATSDQVRIYTTLHTDAIQTPNQNPGATVIPENILFQRVRIDGDYQYLFQSNRYTGAGTVSTAGTTLTCSTNHDLSEGDVVAISSTNKRTVYEILSSTTARLESAFESDIPAGTAWTQGNAIKSIAIQACRFWRPSVAGPFWQWQNGHCNIVVRRLTAPYLPLSIRTDDMGHRISDCLITDSILYAISNPSIPVTGLAVRNCQIASGTPPVGSDATIGAATGYDSDVRPTGGITRKALVTGPGSFPFDAEGSIVVSGQSLIGAIV